MTYHLKMSGFVIISLILCASYIFGKTHIVDGADNDMTIALMKAMIRKSVGSGYVHVKFKSGDFDTSFLESFAYNPVD